MVSSHAITTKLLVSILQSIALGEKTGRLRVEHEGQREREKGEIFFAHGSPVFACTAYVVGKSALLNMLDWRDVYATFFEGEQAPSDIERHRPTSLTSRTTQGRPTLPIELAETRQTPAIGMPTISKSSKSIESVHAHIPVTPPQASSTRPSPSPLPQTVGRNEQPNIYAVFRPLPFAATREVINQMERKDRTVFLLLNGKRTLHTIKQLIHRSDLDVTQTLIYLLQQGYIERVQD